MRKIGFAVLAAGLLAGLTGTPAHAAGVRHCVSSGSWTFSYPLTTLTRSGTVYHTYTANCRWVRSDGTVTSYSYSGSASAGYTGNCLSIRQTYPGTGVVGYIGEHTAYAVVAGQVVVYSLDAHTPCSGATTLRGTGTSVDWQAP